MPATERLYYSDSHLIEFEARVTDKTDRVSGWTAVTLDRTAFYPTEAVNRAIRERSMVIEFSSV